MSAGAGEHGAPRPGGGAIFHVHPSLRCNLACAHCYSRSSPRSRDLLAPDEIASAVRDAAALGFGVLSISGGEPMLYRGLDRVLAAAHRAGMHTQLVTNGWFCDTPRHAAVAHAVDLVALSLDGPEDVHCAMRGAPDAFVRFERATAALRKAGRRFGVVHTVTAETWERLFETAEIAAAAGATLFQIHALEAAGRAEGRADTPDAATAARVFVIVALLRAKYAGQMLVHVDLEHRGHRVRPCDGRDPAQAIGILVLEDDGMLVPTAYGFDRRFALGNIREASLADLWHRWLDDGYPRYLALRAAHEASLEAPGAPEVFNRYERLQALARAQAPEPLAA